MISRIHESALRRAPSLPSPASGLGYDIEFVTGSAELVKDQFGVFGRSSSN